MEDDKAEGRNVGRQQHNFRVWRSIANRLDGLGVALGSDGVYYWKQCGRCVRLPIDELPEDGEEAVKLIQSEIAILLIMGGK